LRIISIASPLLPSILVYLKLYRVKNIALELITISTFFLSFALDQHKNLPLTFLLINEEKKTHFSHPQLETH
jgi:hypothetical protein